MSPPSASRIASPFELPEVFPTVVHMIHRAVRTNPDGEAVSVGGVRATYPQLAASAARFAKHLRAQGAKDDRIAIILPNRIDMVIAILGVMASGAQAVLLNPTYTRRELSSALEDAAPLLIVTESSRRDVMDDLISVVSRKPPVILSDQDGELLRPDAADSDLSGLLPDTTSLALLLYTGGTTGRSKGVNISHYALSLNISQRCALLPMRSNVERVLGMTPLFHAFATHTVLFPAFYAGGAAVFLRQYSPEAAIDAIATEKITHFAGVPTIYNGLTKHPKFESGDYRSLVGAYSGAAPLSTEVLRLWERITGVPIAEGYGLTEATGILCYNPLFGRRKPGSVGVPLPGTEIEIVDAEEGTEVVPIGTLGEIRTRCPQLMIGYRNQPEETAAILRDGWLYTGDIGELDSDGYLFIRDRKKDMALVGGFNVYPREIDEVLYSHPQVVDAVSVGIPDSYRGETIAAFVVLKADATVTADDLIAFCAGRLTRYKVPTQIRVLNQIPKTLPAR